MPRGRAPSPEEFWPRPCLGALGMPSFLRDVVDEISHPQIRLSNTCGSGFSDGWVCHSFPFVLASVHLDDNGFPALVGPSRLAMVETDCQRWDGGMCRRRGALRLAPHSSR
jgi:hypothetical protein